jgi:cell division protein FtsI (penicillin-binding protein 3)
LEYSSNIGVSRIIDDAFKDDPQKFVDGLRRMGVGIPLNLPFVGKGEPLIPQPNSKKRYWSKSDLPWMSIGYVTQQPVINTLTFYNAIANNGKMVKPKFVKAEMYNGELIREFPTEVLIEQICKPSTLKDIQYCLNNVVSIGLGKAAGNGGRLFQVSGKTGTAQIANGKAGYKNGTPRYMISFCGYFPSEAPKYSCIVSIVKQGLPASGGTHCGPVFRQISQYIMAKNFERNAAEIADSLSVFNPSNKKRPNLAENENLSLIPDAVGFGAKDAVYIMKKKGINVKLEGKGTVESQSIKAGTKIEKGQSITLYLK